MDVLSKVDAGRIYGHIVELLGPNHPVVSPERLEAAADYMVSELGGYGVEVVEHRFMVDGEEYRNIEGAINTGESPELLLTAHYDTLAVAPGADDNLSGIAVLLEAARVLSESDMPVNLRVIGFTLEENSPDYSRRSIVAAQELGLMDDSYNYRCLSTQTLRRKSIEYIRQGRQTGRNAKSSFEAFMNDFRDQMSAEEYEYFTGLTGYYGVSGSGWIGESAMIGSSRWVKDRLNKVDVAGVLNLDAVGYVSKSPGSQSLPAGMSGDMFSSYLVDDVTVGDYLSVIGDAGSGGLLELFMECCRIEGVELPYAGLQVPLGFEAINMKMRDILRSDHAPFWREGVPAIFLTDTGNFRYPYYHTHADTIDKLDIDFTAKVCKACAATTIKTSTPHKLNS